MSEPNDTPREERVIFVDDEPAVLSGLRRMLFPLRSQWHMRFLTDPREALAAIEENPVDVVVSDMMMPDLSGVALMEDLRERFPEVVRIIFSGHSDQALINRAIGCTHRFLAKPVEAEELVRVIEQSLALRRLLGHDRLIRAASRIERLPSLPSTYREIREALQQGDCSLEAVGEIVAKDLGMSAKVLQIVNSAYFGLPQHLSSPVDAVRFLGLETITTLVLTLNVFGELRDAAREHDVERLMHRCQETGRIARGLAETFAAGDRRLAEQATAAGMLHDVGQLLIWTHFPEEQEKAARLVRKFGMPGHEAQRRVLGASHAELGAYLLGIWGLADPIVEAVALHHRPALAPVHELSPLACVHIAAAHVAASESGRDPSAGWDREYLSEVLPEVSLEELRGHCDAIAGEGVEHA